MYVPVHAANWRASCAPPFGLFLHSLAAPQGAPFGRHPAAEAAARGSCSRAEFLCARTIATTQCRDARIRGSTGAVRGAEHRRIRGISPKGRGDGSPRSRSSTGTVLSERPREDEKRRAVRFARCESDRRVRCLAFLVTFWALRRRSGANSEAGRVAAKGRMPGVMPKSNRLAEGETKLCTLGNNNEQGAGFRPSPE